VRCLAHVINLAAQQALSALKALEDNEQSNENNGLIHKVIDARRNSLIKAET